MSHLSTWLSCKVEAFRCRARERDERGPCDSGPVQLSHMKASELAAWFASLPPETELEVTVSTGGASRVPSRLSDAERARAYRARKRADRHETSRDGVTGGKGGSSSGLELSLPFGSTVKQGEESSPEPRKDLPVNPVRARVASRKTSRTSRDACDGPKPWRRVPTSWNPTPDHARLAAELGVDLGHAVADFRDHSRAFAA